MIIAFSGSTISSVAHVLNDVPPFAYDVICFSIRLMKEDLLCTAYISRRNVYSFYCTVVAHKAIFVTDCKRLPEQI